MKHPSRVSDDGLVVSDGSVTQKCVDEASPERSLERGERFWGDSGRAVVIVRPVTEMS
jgi:hypothetical protein